MKRYRKDLDLPLHVPPWTPWPDIPAHLLLSNALPRGYRVAYLDVVKRVAVCYPIGLHLIVRLCRRLWEHSLRYRPNLWEVMFTDAVDRRAYAMFLCFLSHHGIKPEERN